jgi:hypothetical protein
MQRKKEVEIVEYVSKFDFNIFRMIKFYLSTALILILTVTGRAQAPNLVTNGSFEADIMGQNDRDGNGTLLSPVYRYVPDHQATITGWNFTSTGNGENSYLGKDFYPDGSEAYGPRADGNYGLRLNVGDGISQSLLLSQGGNYTLSFHVDSWSVYYNQLFVDFGGIRNLLSAGSTSDYSFTFSIATSTVNLAFGYVPDPNADPSNASDEDLGGTGVMLDNIRVSVPEPSALSLLAVGLGGLAMMRRRRS